MQDLGDIKKSLEITGGDAEPLKIKDIKNLIVVVERGINRVWVMEGDSILDKFDFSNIHGGLKFTPDAKKFFIPARDGWVGMYDTDRGFYGRIRVCVNLRNISLSRDGSRLFAACILPEAIVAIDVESIKKGSDPVLKVIPVKGKINAIYELHSRDEAIFTFRDKPLIGIINTKSLSIDYIKIMNPFDDFFIDPLDSYVIGSSRNGKLLQVYSIEDRKQIFEYPIESMPHLFSASYWYDKGSFYFATAHIGKTYLTIWRMYDWAFLGKIDVGGSGFFVRTNSNNPYLWVDNGSDELVLIDKRELSQKRIVPVKGKKMMHTEISGDGGTAYLSIYENDGSLIVYDALTLKEQKRFPASLPVGKYNFVNKNRRYDPIQLGGEVFRQKCWGCHHPTYEAFGPSFRWIYENSNENMIRAYITNPQTAYKTLGYAKATMPEIKTGAEEVEFLLSFIKESANAKDN
ncbi:cytochrome D1 domain-containing protein [uncultured Candidatus Kuenenia sp.]|uniref:cytochrome D1 domain-containing protein n=1 Tax=uncultured Candidatus Kuenenia sp. TaxID=1048336 RepID=UPI00030845DA|nr:cytochrome D1 domain-containing protein [uncultured Candidatus Kuenenia sp.]